jgi:hypothetical protein
MDRYANHGRTQHPSVKHIARLENFQNTAVCVFRRLGPVHRLMKMRVKRFAHGLDSFHTKTIQIIE